MQQSKRGNTLEIYTIYKNPSDYPGKWVMRMHEVPGGPAAMCLVGETLEEVRAFVPSHLIRLSPAPDDDPVIYETWM